MHISGSPLPRRMRRRTAGVVAALTATAVVTGLTASPVASLPPSPECPLAYPLDSVAEEQPVTGLTVSSGTTPEPFSGEIVGVMKDGIAPGLDMIMARLTSPEIDRVGIWQGMSGSPVYSADGRLIGAVAYGLAWGPSSVAGITPAEEMYRLLEDAPSDPTAAATLRVAEGAETVDIPPTMTQRLATSGAATEEEAEDGMSRLPLPLGISGMANAKRLRQAKRAFDLPGVRAFRSGSAGSADGPTPIVAGGNLAASLSYGDVSAVGVGTATAVCGDQVLAFGHPMMFTGPSELTMHGADAVYVQEDPVGPGFKVANAGEPVGAISEDRLSAIVGLRGESAVPDTADITSFVEVPGEWSREGTTRIGVPDAVPDISAFHMLADQDRVFDGIGKGSATVGWRISGTRADGRWFTLVRTDKFASEYDVSYETVFDLYDALAQLHFNGVEDIELERIRTSSVMSRDYRAYDIGRIRVLVGTRWQELTPDRPLFLRPGITKQFLVYLKSKTLAPTRVLVKLPVPKNIGRKSGVLRIVGGNSSEYSEEGYFEEEEYYGPETEAPASFEAVLAGLRGQPHNDQVIAKLMLFSRTGTQKRSVRTTATAVVNGGMSVQVQGLGMPRRFGR